MAKKIDANTRSAPDFTFLSNHSHVLICIAREPETRLRDVAMQVGITERAVQAIVHDLVDVGVFQIEKLGRRNRYHIDPAIPLRHQVEAHCQVGDLLKMAGIDVTSEGRAQSSTEY